MAKINQDEDFEAIKVRARHRLIGASIIALFLVIAIPALLNHPHAVEPKAEEPEPIPLALTDPTARLPAESPEVKAAETSIAPVSSNDPAPATGLQTAPTVIPPMDTAPLAADNKATVTADKKPETSVATVKKEEASPEEPKAKPVKQERGWFVQIGVFAEEARAEDLKQKFKEKGIELKSDAFKGSKGMLTRLRVGPFEDRDQANRLLARVKALQDNAILVHQ